MSALRTGTTGRGLSASRRPCVAVRASGVRARWCIDVEYGHKQTVTNLLQEWVSDVGAKAGLTHTNTRLSSGSVGVAESRLELEVTFTSLSEWEHFLAAIPVKEHRAWSQRVQGMIVGGSPRWELYRAVAAFLDGQDTPAVLAAPVARPVLQLTSKQAAEAQAAAITSSLSSSRSGSPTGSGSSIDGTSAPASPGSSSTTTTTSGGSGLSIIENPQDAEVVLDWKGDPMKVSPGDKLPFKFL